MSGFGVFWLPWLTTAASGSCRLKSAAAIDAEDVPAAHHADESSRMRSARAYPDHAGKLILLANVLSNAPVARERVLRGVAG